MAALHVPGGSMGVLSGGEWTDLPVIGFARGDERGNEFRQPVCYATD